MRATARASPFLSVADTREGCVWGEEKTRVVVAVALRDVGILAAMETMCAAPEVVRWVSWMGVVVLVVLMVEEGGVVCS